LIYIVMSMFVKDPKKVLRAMWILYCGDDAIPQKPETIQPVIIEPQQSTPVINKREEIVNAIEYLKSKNTKTKEDRDKIHMLEVILKSGV